ncbi:hypothetical protein [Nocardia veterana]|uniref:Uncharacterized protein n=1 Tax=Nocardia veterana TaxID=132249 RepID=A0A7X6M1Z0_9NOCA|nr:hypothetical protein [Nocardia veterana]NKY88319.1 hypothetical protein [Nocardia veterana]
MRHCQIKPRRRAPQTPAAGANQSSAFDTEEPTVIALAFGCVVLAAAIYALIVLWPQRIPKDHTVESIHRRVESETRTHHPQGGSYGG